MTNQQFEIISEKDVAVPMRDGTILRADITRPAADDRFPVLLTRTPYDKQVPVLLLDAAIAAGQGYAVVIQDVRGRFASDGDYAAFSDDTADGYDTVEWAAFQQWSNGKVGMFGVSYYGATQFHAAEAAPPHLACLLPIYAYVDKYVDCVYPGGTMNFSTALAWVISMAANSVQRKNIPFPTNLQAIMAAMARRVQARLKGDAAAMVAENKNIMEMLDPLYNHLPIKTMPIPYEAAPFLFDWMGQSVLSQYWDAIDPTQRYTAMNTPALHVGGWYDMFSGAVPRQYYEMATNAATAEARKGQRLIIGPWTHGSLLSQSGQKDFGPAATLTTADSTALHLRWFDYWLKGVNNGLMDEPPVRIFIMGRNEWRNENEWPLARTEYTRYYLHGGGKANSSGGDGRLSPTVPTAESSDAFVYDPKEPVPTLGGAIFPIGQPAGVFDQRPVEARQDVLVYTSDVLTEDLEVTGPLKVELWAASSAPDTDFTAKLVDVHPDGYAQNIQDGIIRARFRESFREPKLIEPGAILKYTIDLNATSNVFLAGHRIRLEISSSNFPHYDRNLNTGHPFGEDAELAVAKQTIFHDSEHPSCIVLPVIPGE